MRISDWSSDVCSSDLYGTAPSPEQDITTNSPKGTIRPKLLQRIEQLWEAARTRSEHLEQKSTATLSGLGIAAPIVIALSAFIVKEPSISAWVSYTSLLLRSEEHTS